MILHCIHKHLHGKPVGVNNHTYTLNADGTVEVTDEADLAVLLAIDGWLEQEQAETAQRLPKKSAGGMKLITTKGEQVEAPKAEEPPAAEAAPEAPAEEPEAPESEGGSWPDPQEDMDTDYLRQMAEAYGVSFNNRTSKATLVARIREVKEGEGK